jgi:hypothetical protein
MIKVLEIILCMYLKTISPDVPRCGRSLHLYVLFITKNREYHNVGKFPKSNRKIVERGKIDTHNTQIQDC